MELSRTRAQQPRVEWRDASPSTNAELRELAAEADRAGSPLPHGTVLLTDNQTAGRGRLTRGWATPPGQALAVSVLVRGYGRDAANGAGTGPEWGELGPGWLPFIAGSAVNAAFQPLFSAAAARDEAEPMRVGMKWPNDIHVRDEEDAVAGRTGKKLCGILCELLPDGSAIIGMGMNLLIPEWELPTDRATSLLAAGADVGGAESFGDPLGAELADRVVTAVTAEISRLTELAAREPEAIRIRAARHSLTLGTEVRVHLPGDEIVDGRARKLADDGALVVDLPTGGTLSVNAGDVQHLR
ncbi:BirA family biotin operon repressor/biotin-[acetyl-CoA-carboxylase] ligase [Leucobacter komagatae]|uniref:BirA family biotin operon repressor/biotin-[acetyl-CoA-carboxylase] ligase n=1 Tax=Leucobacter komagatae TaxID=55969 RepID=A0A542Y8P0_9MICO|nr:biotin--[acetyl-CoA-carboxylase] ligase [Leucobacter komagatae]TQL44449.1 BirA family biotin operon repressor/biotin-[acetyl-CoA-carboxylase] ligase [Leucobacter komagatae]